MWLGKVDGISNMYKNLLAVIAFAGLFFGSQAHAILVTIDPTCSTGDVTTSTDCIGRVTAPQNDQPDTLLADHIFFGINDWVRVQKSDDADPINDPIYNLSITGAGDTSGTWSVDGFNGFSAAVLVLKASTNWAAYLLNTTLTSGTWNTVALLTPTTQHNTNENQPDISHISLYVGGGPVSNPPPSVVPLPAALPLYGTGLAIIGFIGWRRSRKATA
jgi:hypothetical protein